MTLNNPVITCRTIMFIHILFGFMFSHYRLMSSRKKLSSGRRDDDGLTRETPVSRHSTIGCQSSTDPFLVLVSYGGGNRAEATNKILRLIEYLSAIIHSNQSQDWQ